MELTKLKKELSTLLAQKDYQLYEIVWQTNQPEKTLNIQVLNQAKNFTLQDAEIVTPLVSDWLDQNLNYDQPYVLDISSPGAERILDVKEYAEYIDNYIYVQFKQPKAIGAGISATLKAVNESQIEVTYFEKTRKKQLIIPLEDISYIRLAVKI